MTILSLYWTISLQDFSLSLSLLILIIQSFISVVDCASNGSGVSMDMGSDFEVLDECESDWKISS